MNRVALLLIIIWAILCCAPITALGSRKLLRKVSVNDDYSPSNNDKNKPSPAPMGLVKCFQFPILVFLLLLLLNFYIILFRIVQPWRNLLAFGRGLIFAGMNVMILISYGLAVLRDPGQVPPNYLADLETSQNHKSREQRLCDKCGLYKPSRAHHCRVCKRCILRMDHHCSWIGNCVGHRNYKAFLLLIFYLFAACLQSLSLFVSRESLLTSLDFWKLVYGASLFFGILVFGSMLGWYGYLLLHNKTTIEHRQSKREAWIAEKAGQTYRHPYDLGVPLNLISVLGPKTNLWLCPMSVGHIGSGLWWRTASENHLSSESG